jgi:hypothetical protein
MRAFLDYLAGIARALLAVAWALLPQRYWNTLESLPVERACWFSGLATLAVGLFVGSRGLLAYLDRASRASVDAAFELAVRQVQGKAAGPDITTWDLQQLSIFSFVAFLLFTPLGVFSLYLVFSGAARVISSWIDQPVGDPLLTGLDAIARRSVRGARRRRTVATRRRAEGPEVPDRLFTGAWAGLEGVDLVVVASRRKPDWTRGTFVITSDKWYTLGEPFDLQLPQGLRTIYPLTEQKVMEVLRRGVAYELPPLFTARPRAAAGRSATPPPRR